LSGKVLDELEKIRKQALADIERASERDFDDIRVKYLGRKSRLTEILKTLKDIPSEIKPKVGKTANDVRKDIENSLNKRSSIITGNSMAAKIETGSEDITKPGRTARLGSKHVITQTIEEIVEIFVGLGYRMVETGEVETDYYNFTALNTPEDHPARTLQATFYLEERAGCGDERTLLRTQTSPAQIRVMENSKPPLYVIVPGKVYRPDVPDPTHSPMFHQVEGFAVDKEITFGDLKGTLEAFCEKMFGAGRKVRFRPHFFPFTEPSAEVDVSCIVCGGKGCRVCSHTGWLEILGAGIIDPNVFEVVGYDPEEVSGFAFGMAPDRIAMLKYGITDIRMFFENDVRFLEQFK
jgi:phenylalanyl-tRNA synthetase alpha chain